MVPALSACDDAFGLEMWTIQDPAPELGHINRKETQMFIDGSLTLLKINHMCVNIALWWLTPSSKL